MKLQRTGYTETDLLFCDFLKKNKDIDIESVTAIEKTFINWLYTTSGWYDKQITGSYFDIDYDRVVLTNIYQSWLNSYRESIIQSDHVNILVHSGHFSKYMDRYWQSFVDSLQIKSNKSYENYWFHSDRIYPLIKNKKVLVINGFGKLIYNQYISGNIYSIYPNFPEIVNMSYIDFPYCFFNNGPHNNGFETLEFIMNKIADIKFDIALIGAGAYGAIITDKIHRCLYKDSITMCSGISKMFGIDPNKKNDPLWITNIPTEYIPNNFNKIENGRYWIGNKNV